METYQARPTAAIIPMENPYRSCKLTRVRSNLQAAQQIVQDLCEADRRFLLLIGGQPAVAQSSGAQVRP